jgi:hypothetical protein
MLKHSIKPSTATTTTSSGDGRKGHSHFLAGCEDDHRPAQLGRDHHSGAGVEAGRGLRRGDGEGGSLPSAGEGESCGHSHLVHNSPGAWGSGTVHGSDPGDCSHEEEESGGRTHPWEPGRGDVGNGTGKGRGRDVPQSFGSGKW